MSVRAGVSTRREFLGTMGVSVVVFAGGLSVVSASTDVVAIEVKKLFGERKFIDGKIKLDLPTIAENGLVVPLSFEVESPMTEADYVKSVTLFAESNPNPQVAAFYFTPLCPKASASIRIRLAQTQGVLAFAEMSNGEVYTTRKEVKVTIGGCGG